MLAHSTACAAINRSAQAFSLNYIITINMLHQFRACKMHIRKNTSHKYVNSCKAEEVCGSSILTKLRQHFVSTKCMYIYAREDIAISAYFQCYKLQRNVSARGKHTELLMLLSLLRSSNFFLLNTSTYWLCFIAKNNILVK